MRKLYDSKWGFSAGIGLAVVVALPCVAWAQEGPPPAIADVVPAPQSMAPLDTASSIPAPIAGKQPAAAVAAVDSSAIKPGQQVYFPQLPPSSSCSKKDVVGLWRLARVYETPVYTETRNFTVQPYQYLFFTWEDTYKQLKSSTPVEENGLVNQFRSEGGDVQQFVVGENGFTYFYTNGVPTETMACFIVANRTADFMPGDMLLMPPAGQSNVRMVKVFELIERLPVPSSGQYQMPEGVQESVEQMRQKRRSRQRHLPATTVDTPAGEE